MLESKLILKYVPAIVNHFMSYPSSLISKTLVYGSNVKDKK